MNQIIHKNEDTLPSTRLLIPGDMLRVSRYLRGEHVYDHYAIYVGNDRVIHFAKKSGKLLGSDKAVVHESTIERFLGSATEFSVVRFPEYMVRSPEEVVKTAYELIGEEGYNLVFNNCEHFAMYCKTGKHASEQVRRMGMEIIGGIIAYLLKKSFMGEQSYKLTV